MLPACEVIEAPALRIGGSAFAADVAHGLSQMPKTISSAYFYDDRGSRLFQQITTLDEYYLTRCEREILERHADDIAARLDGGPFRLIEIGAGDGHKTEILLRRFLAAGLDVEYVPIDICRQAVVELTAKLRHRLQGNRLKLRGIVAEYFDALPMLQQPSGTRSKDRNLVLFLGSSIGNFDDHQARQFLLTLRNALQSGDFLLVGFDLKKDVRVLQRAYDDSAGVTREFNFNLLLRINRELAAQFEPSRFQHHASYNAARGCMESWLVSKARQQVYIGALDRQITFAAWEGIRVERSYKYNLDQVVALANSSGFTIHEHYLDDRQYFANSLWEVGTELAFKPRR